MKDVEVKLYTTKKILNEHKRADEGWFWVRYSAYPYKGCSNGCRYCYEWDEHYAPMKDYTLLDKVVMVKENAVERLKKELPRKEKDVVCVGDWQPVEAKYGLSRKMLEIVYQLKFPLMIIERAPLLCRDLDLLVDISRQTDAYVGCTIVATRDDPTRLHFEPRGPSVKGRFSAMKRIADQGVMIGTLAMPILPYIFDSDEELKLLVRMTRDAGGQFVLFGGMTLWGTCKKVYYESLESYNPALITATERWDKSKAAKTQWARRCHLVIAEECEHVGIKHFIKRPVSFYPKDLRRNKEIAGMLFVKARDIQMSGESEYKSMAYTRAGRTVDGLLLDIGSIYRERGKPGLVALEGIGEKIAAEIDTLLGDSGQ